MANRRMYLTWVLAACELTGPERTVIRGMADNEPPGIEYSAGRGLAPTMMYQQAVDTVADLPPVDEDGRARITKDDGETYVSILGFGWAALAID